MPYYDYRDDVEAILIAHHCRYLNEADSYSDVFCNKDNLCFLADKEILSVKTANHILKKAGINKTLK